MADGTYTLEWDKKPLGFSIVMDTSGKNAYVSSIQDTSNIEKGLRLAAQIVRINNTDVVDWKHEKILGQIKSTEASKNKPMKLSFRQRTFANEKEKENTPEVLKFQGAPKEKEHRVNGYFKLIKSMHDGCHMWQRDDDEKDPIIVWFWKKENAVAKGVKNISKGLWMISRKTMIDSDSAYACVQSDENIPTKIDTKWEVYTDQERGFQPSQITITQEKV